MDEKPVRHGSLKKSDFGVTSITEFPEHLKLANQSSTEENVALYKAASAGSRTGVESALAKGGKPNFFYRPDEQKNSLHIASENGYAEIVSILLQNGAAVDCLAAATQSTSLILACAEGHEDVVQILLRAGADVNAANCYGNTGLHEASRQGYKNIAELLLAHKASATESNHKGSTALHFLCYGESPTDHPISLAKKLIEAGADVNARDHRGVTPLLACCTSGRLDMIKFLIENGADPTCRDNSKQDAYATAVFYKQNELAAHFNPEDDSPFHRFGSSLTTPATGTGASQQAESK